MNKNTKLIVERFFLKRLKDQLTFMPLNEALDFNDRKEIQRMIRNDINSKKFRQELNKAFRNDFDDAIRAAFGITNRGKISNYVVDKVAVELSSGNSREIVAGICKEVIAKLYKELALRYPFIIKNLRL